MKGAPNKLRFSDALALYFPHLADFIFVKIAGGFISKIDIRGSIFSAKNTQFRRLFKTPGFRLKTGPESKRRGPREGRNAPFSYTYAKNRGLAVLGPPQKKGAQKASQGGPRGSQGGPKGVPGDARHEMIPKGPQKEPKRSPKGLQRGPNFSTRQNAPAKKIASIPPVFEIRSPVAAGTLKIIFAFGLRACFPLGGAPWLPLCGLNTARPLRAHLPC